MCQRKHIKMRMIHGVFFLLQVLGNEGMAGMEEAFPDPETEDALNEFNFLNDSQEGAGEAQTSGEWAAGQYETYLVKSLHYHVTLKPSERHILLFFNPRAGSRGVVPCTFLILGQDPMALRLVPSSPWYRNSWC